MKNILIIFLLILTVILLFGCNTIFNSLPSVSNAIRFVEKKYNIELTVHGKDERIWCYTDEMKSEDEYVRIVTQTENGETTYLDNYFCYMIREEEEAYIQDIFSAEFPESKVYRSTYLMFLPNEYDDSCTFEDALSNYEKYFIESYVFLPYNGSWTTAEMQDKLDHIEQELTNRNLNVRIHSQIVSEELYSEINRYNLDEFFKNYYSADGGVDFETYYHDQTVQHLINFNE